jgi:hypothetical protein
MKFKAKRTDEFKETNKIVIVSGETEFRFEEKYGEIIITKVDLSNEMNDQIKIMPKNQNQIEIS